MRLDRHDIFPLSVVLLFGFVIPLSLWLGFGTRQQVASDLHDAAKTFTIASVAFAVLIGCVSIFTRRREKRILAERGEQSPTDFVTQFTSESGRRAATIIFDTLWELSAVKRMPRLERGDPINGPPLFLAPGDLEERLETVFKQLDFSLWLDPDGASALCSAKTVEQLVRALARFIKKRGSKSGLLGASDR